MSRALHTSLPFLLGWLVLLAISPFLILGLTGHLLWITLPVVWMVPFWWLDRRRPTSAAS